ncbi:MAG: hypothetical protein GU347_04935 [Desulfurococcales archaeon]|nr:hypothetical protein [Desulfurococcales archaeon]
MPISCFKVELNCSYGIAREELQQALAKLVEEGSAPTSSSPQAERVWR